MDDNATSTLISVMHQLTFGWIDYLLFVSLLGLSLLIGVYFGFFSKQDSANEYLFGGRSMAYVPVAISILASFLSGITFLGIPTEVYYHGAYYLIGILPTILLGIVTAYVFIPLIQDLQVSSTYEYLELRFSKTIRTLASSLYVISLLIYVPIVIYVPALAFSQVTGYGVHTISPIFCLVCITYTSMGGVKAVVWTDTIQFIFTVGGLYTFLTIGVKSIGGLSKIWDISVEGKRLDIFNFSPSIFERNTFWGMTIGAFFTNTSRFTIGQKFIQRFLAINNRANIKKALFLMTVGWIIIQISCVTTGLIVYAKYHDCDPLRAKLINRNDQILPFYIMDIAGHVHGLPGIFLAGLVSSALSTMSASLNTLSGLIYEDFIDRWIPECPNRDRKSANIMKLISLVIGLVTIAMIFIIERLGTIFEMSNSLSTIVDGPLLGLFILGMFVPWVGKRGAIFGACVALAFMSWLVGGMQWNIINKRLIQQSLPTSVDNCTFTVNETLSQSPTSSNSHLDSPDNEPMILFRVSFLFFILIGTFVTVATGIITSLVIKETDLSKVDPKHLMPIMRRFIPKKEYMEVSLKEMPPEKIKS